MKKSIIVEGMHRGGPYSHAVKTDSAIYLSGQVGLTDNNKGDFDSQFRVAVGNIEKIASVTGKTLRDVVKLNVYLKEAKYFEPLNALYSEYFGDNPPARTTLLTGFANADVLVELDATLSA